MCIRLTLKYLINIWRIRAITGIPLQKNHKTITKFRDKK